MTAVRRAQVAPDTANTLAPDLAGHPQYNAAVRLAHLVYGALTAIENGAYKTDGEQTEAAAEKAYRAAKTALEVCEDADNVGFVAYEMIRAGERLAYLKAMRLMRERKAAIALMKREGITS